MIELKVELQFTLKGIFMFGSGRLLIGEAHPETVAPVCASRGHGASYTSSKYRTGFNNKRLQSLINTRQLAEPKSMSQC